MKAVVVRVDWKTKKVTYDFFDSVQLAEEFEGEMNDSDPRYSTILVEKKKEG